MADFKNYDPGQVAVSFAGILISGFADGTFVVVERNSDSFEVSPGAGGDVTRVRRRDRSGLITVTLQAEAPANDLLSAKLVDDELNGTGAGEVQVEYLDGTTQAYAANAWIKKAPNIEYSSDPTTREWVIECADLEMAIGGSLV